MILRDSVQYAKSREIFVDPGRGSLPSSAVAYSLGITDVDPFKYDLLFERYLASWMTSIEVWIDIEPSRQREVFDYAKEKYSWYFPKLKISVSHDENCIADMYEVDMIGKLLWNIRGRTGKSVDLNAIGYSDPLVFACVIKGYLNESSLFSRYGMDNYVLGKNINSMDDLIACICLEPDRLKACANNEMVEQYVKACSVNKESIIDFREFKEITENTQGLLIYQEQIIRIFEDIGGISLEQANEVRCALGKMSMIEEYRIKFIYGCKEDGISGCLALGLSVRSLRSASVLLRKTVRSTAQFASPLLL